MCTCRTGSWRFLHLQIRQISCDKMLLVLQVFLKYPLVLMSAKVSFIDVRLSKSKRSRNWFSDHFERQVILAVKERMTSFDGTIEDDLYVCLL